MINFTAQPSEGGSAVTAGFFYDEKGEKTTPKTAFWSLRDRRGEVLNSRIDVPITLAEDYSITLSCADLLITVENEEDIYLTVYGTYDSTAGSDLCMTKQGKIIIDEVIGIGVK
ncbi:MAG: hypothetical protein GY804_04235 [Alphaproteobacteria bacterium]|nr:hypothetical protein [Alphaproteobacteria bacterium]